MYVAYIGKYSKEMIELSNKFEDCLAEECGTGPVDDDLNVRYSYRLFNSVCDKALKKEGYTISNSSEENTTNIYLALKNNNLMDLKSQMLCAKKIEHDEALEKLNRKKAEIENELKYYEKKYDKRWPIEGDAK